MKKLDEKIIYWLWIGICGVLMGLVWIFDLPLLIRKKIGRPIKDFDEYTYRSIHFN